MTTLKFNDKLIVLPPDLTSALSTETEQRKRGDLQVVQQSADLIALISARVDDLVTRMDGLEEGAGQEWAVPLNNEKTARILGDQENKNLTESYNTAQTERVDGMVSELTDNTTRVEALEAVQGDYIKTNSPAYVQSLTIDSTGLLTAPTGSITGVLAVGQLINHSDIPWTRVANMGTVDGTPAGIWLRRSGERISLRARIKSSASPGSNWKLCDLPQWARLASPNNLMYVVPGWTTQATNSSNLQVHSNDTVNDPQNHDIVEMLRPIPNTKYEFTVSWDLAYNMP